MTLVEFFEKTAIENICASLIDMPDRIIFIGNSSIEKRTTKYKEALASKGWITPQTPRAAVKLNISGKYLCLRKRKITVPARSTAAENRTVVTASTGSVLTANCSLLAR